MFERWETLHAHVTAIAQFESQLRKYYTCGMHYVIYHFRSLNHIVLKFSSFIQTDFFPYTIFQFIDFRICIFLLFF